MGRGKKLTRSAIAELKEQYAQLKPEVDRVYQTWSRLQSDLHALETVLARNGVKVKKETEEAKSTTGKSSAATLRLAITEILKSEGKGAKASVIREKLRKNKVPFRPAYFWRVLGRMEGKGTIKRVGTGVYELVNGAS